MVEWSRDYYIDPATTGLNAVYGSSTGADDTDFDTQIGTKHGRAASVNLRLPPSESSMCTYFQDVTCVHVCTYIMCVGDGDGISLSSVDNPEQFQSQKQLKETMESGIQL